MQSSDSKTEIFERNRRRLFGVAYRMLGSASDAEDLVQDAFLRWQRTNTEEVSEPTAWLTKSVVNLSITFLNSARVRRESYVGTWLPEPVVLSDAYFDPAETAIQRETLEFGVLALFERLGPEERAVFVLREALSYTHRQIANTLGLSEANSRQLLKRARAKIQNSTSRSRKDELSAETWRVVEEFAGALSMGDADVLAALLATNVSTNADGGGVVPAARKTISGHAHVLRYLLGLVKGERARIVSRVKTCAVNGGTGIAMNTHGSSDMFVVHLRVTGGKIDEVSLAVNPEKNAFLSKQLQIATEQ